MACTDSTGKPFYPTQNVQETFEVTGYRYIARRCFERDGQLNYYIQYKDSCDCTEYIRYQDSLCYYSEIFKGGSKTEYHYFRNGKVRREIVYSKNFKSESGLSLPLTVLEYNVLGELKYKYNCQYLTRTELHSDGGVKGVSYIKDCDFRPGFSDGW